METKKIEIPKLQLNKEVLKTLAAGKASVGGGNGATITFPRCCLTL